MEMIVVKNVQDISFGATPKWVRILFGSKFIADSKRTRLLSAGGSPYYYFLKEDIRMDLLEPTGHQEETPLLGKASFWTVRDGDLGRLVGTKGPGLFSIIPNIDAGIH